MIMRIAKYDIALTYKPGNSVVIADTLSRAHPPESTTTGVRSFDNINVLALMPISDKRLEEVRKATSNDDVMCQLASVIMNGWPDNKDPFGMPLCYVMA